VIGDASFERGRNAKRLMHTAKIVIGEVQSAGGFQVVEFFREGIRQASKTANAHANGEVLTLHKAGRDVAAIRAAITYFYYRLRHWRGRITPCRIMLSMIPV